MAHQMNHAAVSRIVITRKGRLIEKYLQFRNDKLSLWVTLWLTAKEHKCFVPYSHSRDGDGSHEV